MEPLCGLVAVGNYIFKLLLEVAVGHLLDPCFRCTHAKTIPSHHFGADLFIRMVF